MYNVRENIGGKIIAECKTLEKAKEIARNIAKAENTQLWISTDGYRIWETDNGTHSNVMYL